MPYALIVIGLILIVTGARDTYAQLGAQLQSDFTGQQNFVTWIIAIGSVGALGYVRSLQTFSTLFMALIILAMMLSNQGFFQKFSEAIKARPAQAPPATAEPGHWSENFGIPKKAIEACSAGNWRQCLTGNW